MVVADNNGTKPDMFIGKGSQILVDNAGMGNNTRMNIDLEEGVLTSTVLGPYNYEGGSLKYTLTAGDKSVNTLETYNQLSSHVDHQACTCAMGTTGCSHSGSVSWSKWTSTTSLPTSGNYYLSADVTLSANATISGTVQLCLNGFNIDLNGKHITNTGNLTIMNCRATLGYRDQLSSTGGKLYGGKNSSAIGGAITSSGTLTLLGVNMADNAASGYAGGAVGATGGSVTARSCKFLNNTSNVNGGAMYLGSNVTAQLSGCVFSGNSTSAEGGAIYGNGSTVTLTGGAFLNNRASGNGGAILIKGDGTNSGDLTVTDSEFARNSTNKSGGAIYAPNDVGTFSLTGCLFLHNISYGGDGGTIAHYSNTLTLDSCTFNKNWTVAGRGGAVYTKRTFNATNCTFDGNEAQLGGAAIYTEYTATLTDCIVQNSGKDSNVEKTSPVHYAPSEAGTKLTVNGGQISNNNVTGDGGAIYAVGSGDISASLTVTDAALRNNTAGNRGGAIFTPGGINTFTLTGCTFTGNQSANEGGAVSHWSGTLVMEECTFTSNKSTAGKGGAIYANRQVDATECTFDGNTAALSGAAIYTAYTTNLTDCVIKNSVTQQNGAVCYEPCVTSTKVTITGGEFTGNAATGNGGAIYFAGTSDTLTANLSVTDAVFTGNAATAGGAIYDPGRISGFAVNNCLFEANESVDQGGAIGHYAGTLTLTNSQFIDNTSENGGAIYAFRQVNATNCIFDGNTAATAGAALYIAYQSNLNNCTITNNTAAKSAVYIDYEKDNSGKVTVNGGTITDNAGGAIHLAERQMNMTGAPVITDNTAGGIDENVHLAQNTYLTMGSLSAGASIGITAASENEEVQIATVSDTTYRADMLRSDVSGRKIDPNADGTKTLKLVTRRMASVGDSSFQELQDAVNEAGTSATVVVQDALTNTNTVLPATGEGEAVQIDLNGNGISQGVNVSSEGTTTLYLADSKLSYESTEPTKVLKSALSSNITVSREHKVDNKRYVVLDAGRYYEIHRVQLTVTAKALRPSNNGIGFKVKFSAAQSIPESYLKGFGLSFTVKDGNGQTVTGSYEPKMDLQKDYNKEMINGQELTIVIKDYLSENPTWAEYTVIGTPFIILDDGRTVEVEGAPIEVNFKQMVQYAENNFNSLNTAQKDAVAAMYKDFSSALSGWGLTKIAAYAAKQ